MNMVGDSRVVACLLMRAAERNSSSDGISDNSHTDPLREFINLGLEKQFNLIITEGSPERKGHQAAKNRGRSGQDGIGALGRGWQASTAQPNSNG